MIAHKVTFYSNGHRPNLGQSQQMTLPAKPAQDVGETKTQSLLNTLFILGSLTAIAVLAVTLSQHLTSKE